MNYFLWTAGAVLVIGVVVLAIDYGMYRSISVAAGTTKALSDEDATLHLEDEAMSLGIRLCFSVLIFLATVVVLAVIGTIIFFATSQ